MLINGRYEVVGLLGIGNSSAVLQVVDRRTGGRPAALKLLQQDRPTELLRWEFDQLCRLEHPHLARVWELDTVTAAVGDGPVALQEGTLFFVQELVEGRPADRVAAPLREHREQLEAWVVSVAAALCRALSFVHARGIVHRDVKPANIIVGERRGAVRLIDFGLAATVRGTGTTVAGSLAYMAPEALGGAAEPRSDLFGLGVTLYELLTGRLPFGDGTDGPATIKALLAGDAPLLSEVVDGLSPSLAELVHELLQRSPADRPRGARVVLQELGRRFGPRAVGLDGGATGTVEVLPWPEAGEALVSLGRGGRLVGRSNEIDVLETRLAERLFGESLDSPLVFVGGPAGVGKSALVQEALRRAQLRAAAVEHPVPLAFRGGLREVMGALLEEWGANVEVPRLKAWLGTSAGTGGVSESAALYTDMVTLLVAATSRRPVVAHLEEGDEELLEDFVVFLHRRREMEGLTGRKPFPCAVVVEWRREREVEVLPQAQVPRLRLGLLGEGDVRALIADRWAGELSEPLVRSVVAAARGRPLWVLAALARAAASSQAGRLPEAALTDIQLSGAGTSAVQALAEAIDALPCEQQEVLFALALWGRSATGPELAALLGWEPEAAVARLGELWSRGWVELDEQGRVRRVPGDLAELAAGKGAAWVREVHRRALGWLSREAGGLEDVVERARHAAAAALGEEAGRLALEAGTRLLAAGDPRGAWLHLQRAEQQAPPEVLDQARKASRRAAWAAGWYDRALERWTAAAERGERGAWAQLAQSSRLAGREAEARQWAGLALAAEDDVHRARAVLVRIALDHGDARQALQLAGNPTPGSIAGEGAAALEEGAGLARLALGDIGIAERHFRACLRLAEQEQGEDRPELLARAHNLLGMAAHHRADWAAAEAAYARAEEHARRAGLLHAAAMYSVNLATARMEAGELGPALESLRGAVGTLAGLGREGELAGALYNYGALLLVLGDVESATRVSERARAAAQQAGARHVEAYCLLLFADIRRRRGSLGEATSLYEQATQAFDRLGAIREQVLSSLAQVEALLADGRPREAEGVWSQVEPLGTAEATPELRCRRAVVQGRLALHCPSLAESAVKALAELRASAGDASLPVDLRWRLYLVTSLLEERTGQGPAARRSLALAEQIVARLREQVPRERRRSWSQEPDREALAQLRQRLLEETPERLLEAGARALPDAEALRRILNINKRLNSEQRLGRLLDEIIDTVVELTSAERGFVLLREADGTLRVRSARNMDRRSLESEDLRLSRSLAEQVVLSGEPVCSVDAVADGRFSTATSVHALRLRSVMAVPLRVKGQVVGAVYVDDRVRPGAFGEAALQLVQDVTDQAAIAVENARLLAENKRRQRKIEALNRQLQRELDRQRVELRELRRELDGQRRDGETKYPYDAIVGRSASMTRVFRILDRVIDSEVSVVIQGESGTGKELVARAIHVNGPRQRGAFVSENCGALPETLLESILFGHVRGAFTGADRTRPGLFEIASGGTLFLDEVSEMSPAMQAKLLRVLQEGEVRPIGGGKTVRVDVRVITASNQDLHQMVERGQFREDLFYRLNVITVRLPPLRERLEDIPLLVEHFLEKHGAGRVTGVDRVALQRLTQYGWPGNVRQLENEIMRATVLADEVIREEHLSPDLVEPSAAPALGELDLKAQVEQVERRLIRQALRQFGGNQSRAAQALGLSRYGLQKKLARLGIRLRD